MIKYYYNYKIYLDEWSKHQETVSLKETLCQYGFNTIKSKIIDDDNEEEESTENEKESVSGSDDASGEKESEIEEQQTIFNNKFSALDKD